MVPMVTRASHGVSSSDSIVSQGDLSKSWVGFELVSAGLRAHFRRAPWSVLKV